MGRAGLIGRVGLVVMCGLFAFVLILVGLGHRPMRSPHRPSYARVREVAGIVALFSKTEPGLWPDILKAVEGETFHAAILPAPPAMAHRFKRAPKLEAMLVGASGAVPNDVQAYTDATAIVVDPLDPRPEGRLTAAAWRMPDGHTLVMKSFDEPRVSADLLGLPPGFWVGVLGFGVAGLALVAGLREVGPIRRLTREVARFDGALVDEPTTETGASDVRALAHAVRDMQRRVTGLLNERSFLIGAISHDLKTYLTRLRLRAESLPDGSGRDGTVADLDVMTALIDTALAFARGTTVSQQRHVVDMADLVAVDVAERAATGVPVRLQGDENQDVLVLGDPVALRRVVANLVENAIKFGRSAVEVRAERAGPLCRIVVDDDGPGVAEDQRDAVFSPFYRVEGSRSRQTGGTGLGLPIARQIVEAHGGTVAATSGPLGGARFTVELPASSAGPLQERTSAPRSDGYISLQERHPPSSAGSAGQPGSMPSTIG